MASTPSGGFTLTSTLSVAIPAGGAVLSPYTIPFQVNSANGYASGAGAGQINKVAAVSGTTTISTPVTITLSSVICADGTAGFTHVRELVIYNLSPADALTLDLTVTNSFAAWLSAGGSSAKVAIQPGPTAFRIPPKPLGTTGYTVGSATILTLDPGAATIPYQVIICGD